MSQTLIDIYLDYIHNYSNVAAWAKAKGLSLFTSERIIFYLDLEYRKHYKVIKL